jgi:hypothetical protein
MSGLATERLAQALVRSCRGWLTDDEYEEEWRRLARGFQEAWLESHGRLIALGNEKDAEA